MYIYIYIYINVCIHAYNIIYIYAHTYIQKYMLIYKWRADGCEYLAVGAAEGSDAAVAAAVARSEADD